MYKLKLFCKKFVKDFFLKIFLAYSIVLLLYKKQETNTKTFGVLWQRHEKLIKVTSQATIGKDRTAEVFVTCDYVRSFSFLLSFWIHCLLWNWFLRNNIFTYCLRCWQENKEYFNFIVFLKKKKFLFSQVISLSLKKNSHLLFWLP